jgi:hypothetical protein
MKNYNNFINESLSNLEIAEKIAFELGEEIVEYLGTGVYGKAFSTKSGKVLKLTSDKREFNRAYVLSRNKNRTKYLINYYNVGKVESTTILNFGEDGLYQGGQYYILMDQVLPLSDVERKTINLSNAANKLINSVFFNDILPLEQVLLFDWTGFDANDAIYRETMKELYPHIVNIAKELKKHDITWNFDFHGGNIGWDKDKKHLVFFDIGGYTKKDNYERNNKKITVDEKI